jgi:N-formylglutamate deformylase
LPNPLHPQAFRLIEPPHGCPPSPIIVSCPHTGTQIPHDFRSLLDQKIAITLPDTDWYVNELYDFAPGLGTPVVSGLFSRYVIDLNRDPQDKPLYGDGRIETGLFPQDTFHSKPLFLRGFDQDLLNAIRKRSFDHIYLPYHEQLQTLLEKKKKDFSTILLWEAHSIARWVPRIQKEPFADIMIGDALGTTCSPEITEILRATLSENFETVINSPFKGGHITRHYAKPKLGVMTVQIEMSQDLYLLKDLEGKESFPTLSPRASQLKNALKKAMLAVQEYLVSSSSSSTGSSSVSPLNKAKFP